MKINHPVKAWVFDDSINLEFYREVDYDLIRDLIDHFDESVKKLSLRQYNIVVDGNDQSCREIKEIFVKHQVEIKFLRNMYVNRGIQEVEINL